MAEHVKSRSEEVKSVLASCPSNSSEESWHRTIRMLVLTVLAAQNCSLTLVTSYSRRSVSGPKYLASTVVVANELLKTGIVLCQLLFTHGPRHVAFVLLPRHVLSIRTMRYALPALFYTVQNNLLFFAMDNLDSVTVAVTSQMKVLTTAVFSVIILSRRLSWMHWIALVVLVCGLVVMEIDGEGGMGAGSIGYYNGLLAMLAACSSSGFASVYLELLFKQMDLDIWVANFQLQLFCLPIAVLGMISDLQNVADKGPLHGWDHITCIIVLLNALGGFLVSFSMKYADNILKTFAVSVSLVGNCLLSSLTLSVEISGHTVMGVLLVITSTWLYSIGGRFLSAEVAQTSSMNGQAEHALARGARGPNLVRQVTPKNEGASGDLNLHLARGPSVFRSKSATNVSSPSSAAMRKFSEVNPSLLRRGDMPFLQLSEAAIEDDIEALNET